MTFFCTIMHKMNFLREVTLTFCALCTNNRLLIVPPPWLNILFTPLIMKAMMCPGWTYSSPWGDSMQMDRERCRRVGPDIEFGGYPAIDI